MSDTSIAGLHIVWADASFNVSVLTDFFVDNLSPSYISHSEIQLGRAIDHANWSPHLRENIKEELSEKLVGPPSTERPGSVAIVNLDGYIPKSRQWS